MPVPGINRAVVQAVNVGRSIDDDVRAVFISDDARGGGRGPRGAGSARSRACPLVVVESPYRALVGPLLAYLDVLDAAWPPDKAAPVTFVVVPEYVARQLVGADPLQPVVQAAPDRPARPAPHRRGQRARTGARTPAAVRARRGDGRPSRRHSEPRDDAAIPGWTPSDGAGGIVTGHVRHRQPAFQRAVVALNGGPSDERIVRLAAELAHHNKAELVAVHVVEVDWTLPLDADIAGRSEEVQRVLDIAEARRRALQGDARAGPAPGPRRRRGPRRRGDRARRGPARRRACPTASGSAATSPSAGPSRTSSRTRRARCGSCATRCRGAIVKIVIVGCGRVGAAWPRPTTAAATRSSSSTSDVRLRPPADDLPGQAIRGDGTDEDVLRRAGTEGADVFLALTEGDNRNIMAAQLATEALGVERVVAKINDPVRADGLRRARHRDALPDRPDGRRGRRATSACRRPACPGCWRPTGHHHGDAHPTHARGGRPRRVDHDRRPTRPRPSGQEA